MSLCKSRHTYFNPADFTAEEVARKNKLAMAVLVGKRRICKCCGFESKFKGRFWDIWMDGYPQEDPPAPATYQGQWPGESFEDACEEWARAKGRMGFFSKAPPRYGNQQLHDNEYDARKLAG